MCHYGLARKVLTAFFRTRWTIFGSRTTKLVTHRDLLFQYQTSAHRRNALSSRRSMADSVKLYGFKVSAQSGQKLDSQSGPSDPGTSCLAVGRVPQREAGAVHATPPD